VARKEIAVKKYVVKLSDEKREQLTSAINKGKHPARHLLRARILLKADASDAGDGWSDGPRWCRNILWVAALRCLSNQWVYPEAAA
jgi:hypothetical protein